MVEPAKNQVQIKADEKELLGQYSNLVMIHHNAEEFTLHFIYIFPNVAQGKLVSSLILSPGHAKRPLRSAVWSHSRIARTRSRNDGGLRAVKSQAGASPATPRQPSALPRT